MPDARDQHRHQDEDRRGGRRSRPDRDPAPGELRLRGHRSGEGPAPHAILVEFTAPAPEEHARRHPRPVSVGIALDRSGSMNGEPMRCAREAARRLAEGLTRRDTISVSIFGGAAELIADGVRGDEEGRRRAADAIAAVRTCGMTPLHEGWRLVADAVESAPCHPRADRIAVVLSDGMGNVGETDPAVLGRHAEALRSWDVRTTCVGIGERYHSAQLAGLAEGGGGTLHQASRPEEIIDAVLGEIDRVRSVTVRDTIARVHLPAGARLRTVVGGRTWRTTSRAEDVAVLEVDLGDLSPERASAFAVLLDGDVPEGAVQVEVVGRRGDADDASAIAEASVSARRLLSRRSRTVAGRAASMWHDELVRRGIELNEDARYEEAGELIDRDQHAVRALARGTDEERDLLRSMRRTRDRVMRVWESIDRKEAHAAVMRSKQAVREVRLDKPDLTAMSYLLQDADSDQDP